MADCKKVAVIMGSDSDFPTVSGAVKTLKSYGVPVEVHVMSAHRTPEEAARFSSQAKAEGFGVIIAAAGKAAHLAGVLAAHTTLPVIGIPIKSSTLDGLDALLATVQMPKGIPVATVAIDGADNAALLAVQILALSCEELSEKLETMKEQMAQGEAEAIRSVQQAYADSLKLLNEAKPTDRVIALKSLEAFQKAADGKATKIIIPSEIQSMAGLAASVKELFVDGNISDQQ